MAKYADCFVIPVPVDKLDVYRKISKKAGKIWLEHGALEYRECVGDDLNVSFGTPFSKLTKVRAGETVMFSWIIYKSRKHRDRVNAKAMSDPRMPQDPTDMPFDSKRMSYGGFDMMVDFMGSGGK